jgi:hypothetical protein
MTPVPEQSSAAKPAAAPVVEDKNFVDILKSLLGKTVTVANPESYEDAPVGHQIRAGFYRAKLVGMGIDYLIIMTEYVHAGREQSREPAKQFVPFSMIKRVTLMKSELVVHL